MKFTLFKVLGIHALAVMVLTSVSFNTSAADERAFVGLEKERGLPMRGQTRVSVKDRFGEPASTKAAVGSPPISSWEYDGFIVYFEHELVITTVADEDQLPVSMQQIQ